ncbi:50S ribosomal protein L31 [Candidatus Peregrinibacteria bacterium]|nr:50S ribosomal protein L31 [Candidatus Peregrinibacteria bacterium]
MKSAIHPEVFQDAKTKCSNCAAVYLIPNTVKEQSVETCRNCHPIYTGKAQKDLKGGRVERFRKRMAAGKK